MIILTRFIKLDLDESLFEAKHYKIQISFKKMKSLFLIFCEVKLRVRRPNLYHTATYPFCIKTCAITLQNRVQSST